MILQTLIENELSSVLRFGCVCMALLDIESGIWSLRQQMEALVGRQLTDKRHATG